MAELDIPTPSNISPDDKFYQQKQDKSQKMMFEPKAQLIELPSHGYLYKEVTNDPDIIEKGSIRIRPMTVNEEKILTTPRMVKSGQALDGVFQNCIKSDINSEDLLSSDRVYLMLWLRSVSYGNEYKFDLTCPNNTCEKRFEYMVDLTNHPITEMEDPSISEPFKFHLPIMGYDVYFRLPRGKDEIEMIKMQNEPKSLNASDETIVRRMSSVMIEIKDSESGESIPKNQIEEFVNSMVAGDASLFRDEMIRLDAGVEDIKGITCPHCGHEFDSPIPVTENFFRST
jgi:rRNA maturation protein Nop10